MSWHRWLVALGDLLPRRLRERVFEPACYDLAHDHLRASRKRALLVPKMFAVLLYVATANFPRAMLDNRRPSRLALILGGLATIGVAVLVFLRLAVGSLYAV